MKKSVLITFSLISLVFGLVTFILPYILSPETLSPYVYEDSITEYAQALFFFLAAVFFFLTFFYSETKNEFLKIKTPRNFAFLGLALILFFGAGEEISWGQRIIGFETPDALEEVNEQGEFTLHNVGIFDPTSDSFFKVNRLFQIFWFTLGIAIPVSAMLYQPWRDFLVKLGMPFFPLLLSTQFLLFYILSKLYRIIDVNHELYGGRLTEFRELQHALIFCLIALFLLLQARNERKVKETLEQA